MRLARYFVTSVVLIGAGVLAAVPAAGAATKVSHTHAVKVGTFSFASVGSAQASPRTPQAPPHQPMNKTLRHTTAAQVPNVTGTPVVSGTGGAFGFNGLDDFEQTNAGTGIYANSQFDVTPPDQGLCVGNGDVVEPINLAVRVYSTDGTPLTATVPLNQFVGAAPETQVAPDGTVTFGPFLSDPRCYYDPDTGRWFLSVLQISVDPQTGALGNSSLQYVAVSQTSDPTGTWTIYQFPTTDDGTDATPADPGCPCFGDQPLLGADANGIYITTNEYSITGPAFDGDQLYAMSKVGVEHGTNTTVTHLQPGLDPSVTNALGGVAFSIEPAESPNAEYDPAANGTEYFQSALDFGAAPALGTRANRVAVWSLTDTASLNTATPAPALHVAVLPSEEYTQPPNATQAPGTLVLNKRLPLVEANDDRMMQVVYAGGHLWSGLNTAVKTQQGSTLAGIAWFVTSPATGASGGLSASMAGQGYLAVNQEDVIYPSIGVTPAGAATMAFTLVGPDYHPSAAWTTLSPSLGTGLVYVAAAGQNAADDLSSVKSFGGSGSVRWGDYSAAVSDPSGTIWMAAEYISGLERTPLANWATYVYHVTP
jgi:hypothetical protein